MMFENIFGGRLMKNYIKAIFIFVLITFMISFQPPDVSGEQPQFFPKINAENYSTLMELYNDNSKMKSGYDHWVENDYYVIPISFDFFCEIYNEAIESNMFVYFKNDPDRSFTNTSIIFYGLDIYSEIENDYDLQWETYYENATISIEYERNEELIELWKLGDYNEVRRRYGKSDDYFSGCSSCKQEPETIVINGQECAIFWEYDNEAWIVYDSDKLITVHVSKTENGEGKVTKDYVREFLSDIVFSAYIPPEDNGGTDGKGASVE